MTWETGPGRETGWCRIDNYAICGNTVTELCQLQRCEKLCETILICKFSALLKTYKDESLSFFLSDNVCKNACKMPSVGLFPFTDKING